MKHHREERGFWTKENCYNEALKYNNRTDLQNNASGCYAAALKNGWLDEICSHMILIHHKNNYWSKEKCSEEASKYVHRIDFIKNSNKAYRAASKKGWLEDICKHMIKIGDTYSRCIYAIEFSDNSVYIGLTYNINKRFKDHITDVKYNSSSVLKYIKKTGLTPFLKQLTDYLDVEIASKLEEIKKKEYEASGWNIINKVKCGGIGGNKIKWNKENCKKAASQFKTKMDFRKNCGSAYTISLKNKWLTEICSHM
jgi:predicted GIY-YIG superfamily endonuclease